MSIPRNPYEQGASLLTYRGRKVGTKAYRQVDVIAAVLLAASDLLTDAGDGAGAYLLSRKASEMVEARRKVLSRDIAARTGSGTKVGITMLEQVESNTLSDDWKANVAAHYEHHGITEDVLESLQRVWGRLTRKERVSILLEDADVDDAWVQVGMLDREPAACTGSHVVTLRVAEGRGYDGQG